VATGWTAVVLNALVTLMQGSVKYKEHSGHFVLAARPACVKRLCNCVQAESKQPPSGSAQSDGIKRGPAARSHAVYSVFDSLADMEQDQEESVVKSWSSGLDGLQESQPVKHEDEGLDVRHYNSIRSAYT